MNKEYRRTGEKVEVRDEKGELSIRDNIEDIEKLLILENRVEQIEEVIKEERSLQEIEEELEDYTRTIVEKCLKFVGIEFLIIMGSAPFWEGTPRAFQVISDLAIVDFFFIIKLIKDRNILERQQQSIDLVNQLNQKELEIIKQQIANLNKDKSILKITEPKELLEDPYLFNYINRVYQLAELDYKKLKKLKTKKKINHFFDSIGCSEEDKKIYLEILNLEKFKNEESFAVKEKRKHNA